MGWSLEVGFAVEVSFQAARNLSSCNFVWEKAILFSQWTTSLVASIYIGYVNLQSRLLEFNARYISAANAYRTSVSFCEFNESICCRAAAREELCWQQNYALRERTAPHQLGLFAARTCFRVDQRRNFRGSWEWRRWWPEQILQMDCVCKELKRNGALDPEDLHENSPFGWIRWISWFAVDFCPSLVRVIVNSIRCCRNRDPCTVTVVKNIRWFQTISLNRSYSFFDCATSGSSTASCTDFPVSFIVTFILLWLKRFEGYLFSLLENRSENRWADLVQASSSASCEEREIGSFAYGIHRFISAEKDIICVDEQRFLRLGDLNFPWLWNRCRRWNLCSCNYGLQRDVRVSKWNWTESGQCRALFRSCGDCPEITETSVYLRLPIDSNVGNFAFRLNASSLQTLWAETDNQLQSVNSFPFIWRSFESYHSDYRSRQSAELDRTCADVPVSRAWSSGDRWCWHGITFQTDASISWAYRSMILSSPMALFNQGRRIYFSIQKSKEKNFQ